MDRRLSPGETFLWLDEAQDRRARARAGEIVAAPVNPRNPVRVPSGLIHHWVGAVFIPGVTLKDTVQVLRDYSRYKDWYPPTVIDSKVIANGEAEDRFSMLLLNRTFFSKTAFDTDYESCLVRVDDFRAYSVSRTTRIQEIAEYGGPGQHFLPEGDGTGLIWRLFSMTRYVERDGGVYFELEAIGLSRDIPSPLRWLVEPIVRRVSRESLLTSLRQTESAVQPRSELANRKPGGEYSRGATAYGAAPPHAADAR